jgi:hypothetical protein
MCIVSEQHSILLYSHHYRFRSFRLDVYMELNPPPVYLIMSMKLYQKSHHAAGMP